MTTPIILEKKKIDNRDWLIRLILVNVFIFIFFTAVVIYFGNVQWNYDINKCYNMKGTESNYQFEQKIEINSKFNENCYYLQNYPFAKLGYFASPIIIILFFQISVSLLILFTNPLFNLGYNDDNSNFLPHQAP